MLVKEFLRMFRMKKVLNTNTKKFLKLRQFLLESVEESFGVFLKYNPYVEDGWLFSVYTRKKASAVTIKVSYDTYIKHKGDWFRDMTLSEEGRALGGGWYGQEVVLKPIGEMVLLEI